MVERQQITLQIEGMTCDGCAGHVRKALASIDGVHEVRLPTWQAGKAEVLTSDTVVDEVLINAIEQAGYRAFVREKRPVSEERKIPERAGADYDLMIVGGGSAAFAAAIKGAELGAAAVGTADSGACRSRLSRQYGCAESSRAASVSDRDRSRRDRPGACPAVRTLWHKGHCS
jgi:mercuric reductase